MNYIRFFNQIGITDISSVGGKNASLGEMIQNLSQSGVRVPGGFALTVDAYHRFMSENKLVEPIASLLVNVGKDSDLQTLERTGKEVRRLILNGKLPSDIVQELSQAYVELSNQYSESETDVAVRSSATAEDLPSASFAGQQETYLNVHGIKELEGACVKAYASLFTDRAIYYRLEHGFAHEQVALSIGIQKMVKADVSGVAFSLDTETGFDDVVLINASYGLGEMVVQGKVVPDEFLVHKQTALDGYNSLIRKSLGSKKEKMIYQDRHAGGTQIVPVDISLQHRFSLTDAEILALSKAVIAIEDYYTKIKKAPCPVDVEWAFDETGTLYILQARPETVFSQRLNSAVFEQFRLTEHPGIPLVTGQSIGSKIASGVARVLHSLDRISTVQPGDIIVTSMTDPDWVPALKKCSGIITVEGGRTCHAAIVSRELGIPAIVGAHGALDHIKQGEKITMDCSRGSVGYVYAGSPAFERITHRFSRKKAPVDIFINVADPRGAFRFSSYPVAGIGLARLEFVISNEIKIHPMALIQPEKVTDAHTRSEINEICRGYDDKKEFYVDTLAQAIGMLAASMYPRPVTVRLSDFKSNEYRSLIGGSFFEPEEENPMIGLRGASRYYDSSFKDAFKLECAALKKARNIMGMKNIRIMVPFVRTLTEAKLVVEILKEQGFVSGVDGLELVMMVEIPSNVILLEDFARYFDSFSIGSNDLTQMTLGVDRDSSLVSHVFDERDPAVIHMLFEAIFKAHKVSKTISICGQAPSDYPDLAKKLVDRGIDGISLNPDSVYDFLQKSV